MNFLRKTSEVIERYRIAYPQYWLDQMMNEIHAVNKGQGGPIMTGQVLAILRHPQLEREVTIPGAGILRGPLASLKKAGYVLGVTGRLPVEAFLSVNLVGNAGDVYYAERGAGEAVTDDFTAAAAGLRLGSSATAVAKTDTDVTTFLSGTDHARDASYPQTNDGDSDNTGAGVDIITWTYPYLTSEGNATGIQEGAIGDLRASTPTVVLTHFLFAASFDKTSSDTLKCIINHEILGV